MRKPLKGGDGAIMLRMAAIEAELTEIARRGLVFDKRAAKAEPLRKELAELQRRLWGGDGGGK